jgi:hypothetical protein
MESIDNNLRFKRIGMEVSNNGYTVFFVMYKHIPLVTMTVVSKKDHSNLPHPGYCTCCAPIALVQN